MQSSAPCTALRFVISGGRFVSARKEKMLIFFMPDLTFIPGGYLMGRRQIQKTAAGTFASGGKNRFFAVFPDSV